MRPYRFAPLLTAAALVMTGCGPAGNGDGEEEGGEVATEVAVEVGAIKKKTLRARVETYGVVEPEPAHGGKPGGRARLTTAVAGIVLGVEVNEGQTVERGDMIVRLDDRVALAALDKARHAEAFAKQVVERQAKLKAVEGTSLKTVQEAEQQLSAAQSEVAAAQAALALVHLVSPLDGVVTRITAQAGEALDANTVAAEILDTRRLVVTANVPATETGSLAAGQPAELRSGDGSGAVRGEVVFVSPQVDPANSTSLVRVSLPAGAGLRPGQFLRVSIVTEERADCLVVPREAVYTAHDGASTLSVVTGNTATQKRVETGLRDGDLVEVAGEGIAEGATVVTTGSYALPEETKVRVISGRK